MVDIFLVTPPFPLTYLFNTTEKELKGFSFLLLALLATTELSSFVSNLDTSL